MSNGSIELITFRTTRDDHPFMFALNGLWQGLSSGHVAARIKFTNKLLFTQYIQHNPNIPHKIIHNKLNNTESYEIYLSFWPYAASPWTDNSRLATHKFDCEQSANYSSMEYTERFAKYLQPITKIAYAGFHEYCKLFYSIVTLPPAIILHTSRLGMAFGDHINLKPNTVIMQAAEQYAKHYRLWRKSIVMEQNAKFIYSEQENLLLKYNNLKYLATLGMLTAEIKLKNLMYPGEKLSHQYFMHKLEPFVTFGNTERDSISLPLSHGNDSAGLELEPLLQKIKHIADNPFKYPYNVFSTNCAHTITELLWHSCKDCLGDDIKKLILPWYARLFGSTITPTMVMQQATKLKIN